MENPLLLRQWRFNDKHRSRRAGRRVRVVTGRLSTMRHNTVAELAVVHDSAAAQCCSVPAVIGFVVATVTFQLSPSARSCIVLVLTLRVFAALQAVAFFALHFASNGCCWLPSLSLHDVLCLWCLLQDVLADITYTTGSSRGCSCCPAMCLFRHAHALLPSCALATVVLFVCPGS